MMTKTSSLLKQITPFFMLIFMLSMSVPQGLSESTWWLFSVFATTIVTVILNPLPIGAICLIAVTFLILSKTLSFQQAFFGFGNEVVWLIICAFFVARGFIKTGLGSRVSYFFIGALGNRSLGIAYGVTLADLFLSPAIPSVTARTGGIIYPMVLSIARAFGSDPSKGTENKIGSFLTVVLMQASCVTSAMFLTGMAANPLIAELCQDLGYTITWGTWLQASIVPGLLSLILIPLLAYVICPPEITKSPDAVQFAKDKAKELGEVKKEEIIMGLTFFLMVILWIFGPSYLSVGPTHTALLGLCILILTGILSWTDVRKEDAAWDTFVWFSVLLMMATNLNKMGMTDWFSTSVMGFAKEYSWVTAFPLLSMLYFFIHYFFASSLAHVGALFSCFLGVSISIGTPPPLACFTYAFYSSLFCGLTHYASGPAAILFGSGYLSPARWWKLGFTFAIANILIWGIAGGLWWKYLGLW